MGTTACKRERSCRGKVSGKRSFEVAGGLLCGMALATSALADQTIARYWDEQVLSAIRNDTPHPPVQARNLFHFSVAMYDAWAVYDVTAVGYLFREKHTASDISAARREAISYAAYRLLKERYFY